MILARCSRKSTIAFLSKDGTTKKKHLEVRGLREGFEFATETDQFGNLVILKTKAEDTRGISVFCALDGVRTRMRKDFDLKKQKLDKEIEAMEKKIQKNSTDVARQEELLEKRRSERDRVWVNQAWAGFRADSEIFDFYRDDIEPGHCTIRPKFTMDIDSFCEALCAFPCTQVQLCLQESNEEMVVEVIQDLQDGPRWYGVHLQICIIRYINKYTVYLFFAHSANG
jgi:hypothetical protein